ncbi:hypothetical protein SSP24_84070 [Streptomyces spinoverrucosus]|uniref:Uncharacterized protein n=1 Tax=Streptomyces spinoverrucosus TaxID=284043 RepID=A0A4Y3VUW1_9ACTN|nr:hypothetical protein SSP24_84070 [Streptomyces spinoverrucosus]GHC00058.1 hypothetical protein GCM10010397_85080 [Streptomyces spinoverrucosus]
MIGCRLKTESYDFSARERCCELRREGGFVNPYEILENTGRYIYDKALKFLLKGFGWLPRNHLGKHHKLMHEVFCRTCALNDVRLTE